MVQFYNRDSTENYVTLVDHEVTPEVETRNEDSDKCLSMRQRLVQKIQCSGNTMIIRTIIVFLVLLGTTVVAALSYRAYIQDREIHSLRKVVASVRDLWNKGRLNSTLLCNFSISDLQYGYKRSRKIGDQKGSACVNACLHMKQIDPLINGVTVFVDPAKEGCWCQRNMTSISKWYKSCFLKSDNTTMITNIDNTGYACKFEPGDGAGGTEVKIGNQKGNACINACLYLKQFDNKVNGVTVFANPSRGGCWCEKGMRKVYSLNWYKTCRLVPKYNSTEGIDSNVCNFSIGYAEGGSKFSMGKRNARQCINDCLHMKVIDPSINGVTINPKNGDCWCDQNMKTLSGKYKTCFLKPINERCAENNISYHGNDIKNIRNVDSWTKCSDLCRGLAECRFWTWLTTEKSCYLKSSDRGRTPNLNGISGWRMCGAHICDFSIGNGADSPYRKIGEQKGRACVDACLHMKLIDPSINGVTVYSDPTKGGCLCRRNMTRIDGIYRTCFLEPKTTQPLTDFNDTRPTCEFKDGHGSGVTEVYLGMFKGNACINACLHLKKIDNTVDGVTLYSNSSRAGCWCEKGMRVSMWGSKLYKSCKFKYSNIKRKTQEFNGTSLCKLSNGSGVGNTLNRGYIGRVSAAECVEGCLHMRRIDPSINGITLSTITERCWCERNMKTIGEYKTCFLKT